MVAQTVTAGRNVRHRRPPVRPVGKTGMVAEDQVKAAIVSAFPLQNLPVVVPAHPAGEKRGHQPPARRKRSPGPGSFAIVSNRRNPARRSHSQPGSPCLQITSRQDLRRNLPVCSGCGGAAEVFIPVGRQNQAVARMAVEGEGDQAQGKPRITCRNCSP
jgi:hypothetical protein